MGAEAASILHREGDQDVRTSMDSGDGLSGSAVGLQLFVFGLFCCIAGGRCRMLEDGVAVDNCYHCIHHQVAPLREEVKDNHVSMPGRVSNT